MNRNLGILAVVVAVVMGCGMVIVSGKLTAARAEVSRLQTALHTRQTPAGQVQAAAMMVGILRPVSNVTVRRTGEPVMLAPSETIASVPSATPAPDATNATSGEGEAVSNAVAGDSKATVAVAEKPMNESDLAKAIEQMVEDWRARHVALENSTIATMGLNAEQAEIFRKTMVKMNDWLRPTVYNWTNKLSSGSVNVTEEPCLRVANELSSFILLTYSEMDRCFGLGWRSKVPKGFTLTDFIDPSIGIPMVEAQKLLRDRQ